MAKIAQLIEAGDYLIYKGDWATNTAYNINDVVTWADDGHLYEVIKAHTSSDTIKPNNTEYYKAMTSRKILSRTFAQNQNAQLYQFLNGIEYAQIKFLEITMSDNSTFPMLPQNSKMDYSTTVILDNSGAVRHTLLSIYSSSKNSFYVDVAIDGSRTKTTFTPKSYTVYYEE